MNHDPLAPSPLAPGYRLDRYELLCPVAQGGMASVWLARLRAKHGFERLVAIKTILPNLASDVRFQQMFLDEARLASKIDHANVAHVLDLGDEHGVLYLVMEWVDGDSISKLQRALAASNVNVPFEIALRIMADACAGLHAAHELCDAEGHSLGVVHRDVSPQNVLINTRGIVKVIDFGIAKARDRAAGETSTGSLKGKIQFMAPEQAVGKPIDRRADVWAAGAVLYSLLSGDPPFDGPNQFATLHRIASGEAPPRLPVRVPGVVADIAYKALQFEPSARFETAAVMQRALEAAMIATRKAATSADVAAFAATHLAARVETRKKAVDVATRAAAERDRVEKFLKAPDSSSGYASIDVGVGLAESGANNALQAAPYPSTRSQVATVPDAIAKMREDDEPKSSQTSPTLHASDAVAAEENRYCGRRSFRDRSDGRRVDSSHVGHAARRATTRVRERADGSVADSAPSVAKRGVDQRDHRDCAAEPRNYAAGDDRKRAACGCSESSAGAKAGRRRNRVRQTGAANRGKRANRRWLLNG